ncbi:MAG: cobalamin-dependent protein [Nitrospiraceae bacterium]|nr:cobalamin-dependent protein [Nitrospiraceae bacterium]
MISANRNSLPEPVMPAGACMVAEAARDAGHEVKFLDFMFLKWEKALGRTRSLLRGWRPDVTGISARNIDGNNLGGPVFFARELPPLVRAIREQGHTLIVLGGAAVSVMPEELLRASGADCAVLSGGTRVFPKLLERVSRGAGARETAGTAWLSEGDFKKNAGAADETEELEDKKIPVPDYAHWLDTRRYTAHFAAAGLQTKLGCRFDCIYCTYKKIEGGGYRLHSAEAAAHAVERLWAAGFRDVEFVDNVFNCPCEHAMGICEALVHLKERGVRPGYHTIELNPLFVTDELVSLMERAGFAGAGITAESASDAVLHGLQKGFCAEHVYRAAGIVGRHRLPCFWIFLLGGPGETRNTVEETLRFAAQRIRPSDPVFFNTGLRIYPGTELERTARREGLLSLPAEGMLEPVFYVSPEVDPCWIMARVGREMGKNHLNFIDQGSLGFRFLPLIHRMFSLAGTRPPLWRFTRTIRRVLRPFGIR